MGFFFLRWAIRRSFVEQRAKRAHCGICSTPATHFFQFLLLLQLLVVATAKFKESTRVRIGVLNGLWRTRVDSWNLRIEQYKRQSAWMKPAVEAEYRWCECLGLIWGDGVPWRVGCNTCNANESLKETHLVPETKSTVNPVIYQLETMIKYSNRKQILFWAIIKQ